MKSPAIRLLAGAAAIALAAGSVLAQDTTETPAPAETTTETAAEPAAEPAAEAPAETPAVAAGETAATADDPIVATVNGEPVLRSEVLEAIGGLPPQYQQMPPEMLVPLMAEQVATARLVAQRGYEAGLADDPEVAGRVAEAERRIIQDTWLSREVEARITDEMVDQAYQAYLAENPPAEEISARHILVDGEDKAKALIDQLNGGADFGELASANTTDPSGKETGGDLGWFTRDQMVPEFAEAAFAMEPGSFSNAPVQSQFGWHVIQVDDKRTVPQPTIEEIRPQLEDQLAQTVIPQIIGEVREGAEIVVLGPDGQPLPPPGNPPAAEVPAAPDAPAAEVPVEPTTQP